MAVLGRGSMKDRKKVINKVTNKQTANYCVIISLEKKTANDQSILLFVSH